MADAQQKKRIAAYFVNNAPTGEVEEVTKDVKVLVDDPTVLTPDVMTSILREYNTQQFLAATVPGGGRKTLVAPFGQVAADKYLDPSTGKVLTFDHLEGKFTGETDQKQVLDAGVASYRSAIETGVDEYVGQNYGAGKATASVFGTDDGDITVCISAKNTKLAAFWTGGWRSRYTLSVKAKGQVTLEGFIKINVHYYEDGNVQLHTEVNKSAKLEVASPADTAKAIVAAIAKIEDEFQQSLEEVYVQMHSVTFKAMRRFLPVSRVRMNWSTAAHSLASEVSK